MKKSQVEIVRDALHADGRISRNQCLQQFITRLAAVIQILEKEQYVFETKREAGDYVYLLKSRPVEKSIDQIPA